MFSTSPLNSASTADDSCWKSRSTSQSAVLPMAAGGFLASRFDRVLSTSLFTLCCCARLFDAKKNTSVYVVSEAREYNFWHTGGYNSPCKTRWNGHIIVIPLFVPTRPAAASLVDLITLLRLSSTRLFWRALHGSSANQARRRDAVIRLAQYLYSRLL